MLQLNNVQVSSIQESVSEQDLAFLMLSGYKAFHNQGYKGQGVIIADIDTGINPCHPELQGKCYSGKGINYYTEGFADDNGHGTHVAATEVGETVGIAPNAMILPIKVLGGDGTGRVCDLVDALHWVREWRSPEGKRVDIVGMSLACDAKFMSQEEINDLHAAVKALVDDNIAVICSAGNSGDADVTLYPAHFHEPITTGAVDVDENAAYFSTPNNEVDLAQIGVDVMSAWYKGGYIKFSGTSMSRPIITGIAALLISKYKALHNGEYMPEPLLYEMLRIHCIDIGIPGVDPKTGAGFCTLNPNSVVIKLHEFSSDAEVNGQIVRMDTQPIRQNDRLHVPIRFVSEIFGAYVNWDEENRTATIKL